MQNRFYLLRNRVVLGKMSHVDFKAHDNCVGKGGGSNKNAREHNACSQEMV